MTTPLRANLRLYLGLVSTLLFVSAASGQVTTSDPTVTVTVLTSAVSGPTGLAFRPLSLPQPTHDLVVGQFGTNTVPLVDAISGATTSYVSQTAPSFIAVRASDDLVAVTPQSAALVNFYDTAGTLKGTISARFAGGPTSCLVGVAFDSAGNFYVATGTSTSYPDAGCPSQVSAGMSSIYEFAGATPWSVLSPTLIASGLDALQGLAFTTRGGPSGSLFAVSNFNGKIYQEVLGAASTTTPIATDPSAGGGDPTGIAVDPVKGDVYITEFTGGTLTKLKIPALTFSTFASGFTNPSGLGFDTGGNGYVADFGANKIWKFSRPAWIPGDVFVAVGGSQYNVYRNVGTASVPNYRLLDTINDGTGGDLTTGCGFDSSSNLFTTNFSATKVVEFDASAHVPVQTIDTNAKDSGGNSESLLKDSSNNLYVGDPDGSRLLLKYDSTGAFKASFTPASEVRGTDWIDLSADQKTVFYTSEGTHVKRFDVSGAGQLSDFNSSALTGANAYALRLLPPFDGSGGLLVADTDKIRRLDSTGAVIQTYDAACTVADPCGEGGRLWFALNLDPNGTSFWAGDPASGDIFRFNIASGAIEFGPIKTPAFSSPGGICLKGEPAAVNSTLLTFPMGADQSQIASYNCPAGPPCTNPDAHSIKFTATQVNTPFSIAVTANYVPTDLQLGTTGKGIADGVCETGADETTDYDCRYTQFFSGPAVAGGTLVPQCYPYSDNSCVFYRVTGDPGPGFYSGDIYVYIAWNTTLTPHGSFLSDYQATPHMYDDPSDDTMQNGYPVIPGFPYAPENHQFVFDITTYYNPNPNQVGVDQGTGGRVPHFNDFALAFPLTNAALGLPTYAYTWVKPVDNPNFHTSTPGSPTVLQVRFTLTPDTPAGVAVTSPHHTGVAILSGDCTTNPTPDKIQVIQVPAGSSRYFSYNPARADYEFNALTTFPTGQYSARVNSDLFPNQCADFRIKN